MSEKIKIYMDYIDFLDREDKSTNGCTKKWLDDNKLTLEEVAKSLIQCFGTFNCRDCVFCHDCSSCESCNFCIDCDDCSSCNYSKSIVGEYDVNYTHEMCRQYTKEYCDSKGLIFMYE